MRHVRSLLLSCFLLFAASCSALPKAVSIEPSPDLKATADLPIMTPAQMGLDPVQTGRQLLEAGGRRWLESPAPVFVQQMSYGEAHQWIPMLSEEGDQFWGTQTSVWLVILKGRWAPTDSAQASVTYDGCLLVLFRSADGQFIAAGDSLCPGQQ